MPDRQRSDQRQTAGNDSQQIQVNGNIYVGITEERAREIAHEIAMRAIAAFANEAQKIAQERVQILEQKVTELLAETQRLDAFRSPEFLMLVGRASQSAAISSEELDFDTLAQLLNQTVGVTDRRLTASIDRAVQVVPFLDATSLGALTAATFVSGMALNRRDLNSALRDIDSIFEALNTGLHPGSGLTLPAGLDWIDHLDTLDAIRSGGRSIKFKKFAQIHSDMTPGFFASGFSDERYREAPFPGVLSREHELAVKPYRFDFVNERHARAELTQALPAGTRDSEQPVTAALNWMTNVGGFLNVTDGSRHAFREKLKDYSSLNRVVEWWDEIPHSFTVTLVGKVLVQAHIEQLSFRDDLKDLLPRLAEPVPSEVP